MTEIINFFIIFLTSIYIIFLRTSNSIEKYIGSTFVDFITIFAIFSILISIIGIYQSYKNNKRELILLKNKNYTFYIFIIIILSIFISPILIILLIIMVLVHKHKNDDFFSYFLSKSSLKTYIPLLVLITGIFIPSIGISSNIASQRFTQNVFINKSLEDFKTTSFGSDSTKFSIGDWIASFNINPNPQFYKDKKVKVSGFIFKPDILEDIDFFMIARFIIRCCAADATPTGLYVHLPKWYNEFRINQWVEIEGFFEIKNINNIFQPIIKVTKITPIDQPSNPYIT